MTQFLSTEQLDEWVKCRDNPIYFAKKFCYIFDPVRGKMKFDLYKFQEFVLYSWWTCRLNVMKKPRQMGITWCASVYALWFALFRSYKNILIISIKEKTAIRFLGRIKFIYRSLPEYMKKKIVNGKKGDDGTKTEIEWSDGSRIESVSSSEDAGRSEGVSLAMIDEAAFIQHMEAIWKAIFPTLSVGGDMILFSTTNGVGNRYHKVWQDSKANKNGFNPILLDWRMHPDRDQAWYDQQREALGARGCAQEGDGEFLTSGDNVFDLITLRNMEDDMVENPVEHLPINPFLTYMKRIEAVQKEAYLISPSLSEPKVLRNSEFASNEMLIFEYPDASSKYVLGADTAKGKAGTGDESTIVVLDDITMKTVFEYSGQISIDLFSTLVVRVGEWYNLANLCIENVGIGLATVKGVRDQGYPIQNMYKEQRPKIQRKNEYVSSQTDLGFPMNVRTKPIMIADLIEALQDGSLTLISNKAIQQFQTYITNTTGQMEAADGYLDDLVIGYGLAIQCRTMQRFSGGLVMHVS